MRGVEFGFLNKSMVSKVRVTGLGFNIKNARGGCFVYSHSYPPVTPVLLFNPRSNIPSVPAGLSSVFRSLLCSLL